MPMESFAAAPHARSASFQLSERIEPLGVWLFGFLLVGLLAGNDGGFFPAAWAWAAFSTWLLVAVVVAGRPRTTIGALDLTMMAGMLAFGGWFALSALWSRSVPSTLDESTRYLAYVGIVVAAFVVVERRTVPHLLGGVTAAITLLSLYALGTRVLPDRLGAFESILGYRLTGTIGYWNGLGIFAVIGLFLALGFAARAERLATRSVAGATLPVLAATMYFTFSRGAWLALLVGFVAALVVDARRLQLAFASAVLGVLPAVGVLLASKEAGLTQQGASFASAVRDGHRFAPVLVLLAALTAGTAALLWLAERHIRVPPSLRLAWAAALVVVLLAGIAVVWQQEGSPVHVAQRVSERAQTTPQATGNNGRLFDLSSNGRFGLWHTAWDTFSEHPVAGVGGGTYWQEWVASWRGFFPSTEAHGVYAETLAELGIIGLVLLLFVLLPPVAGAVRARHSPLVPFAFAAFAGWAVHAGVDWDWELMGVSGAALLCGAALISAGRGDPRLISPVARGGGLVLAAALTLLATTSVLASARLDAAQAALGRGDLNSAATDARSARRFAPWSTRALELTAAVRLDQGRQGEAREAYRAIVRRDPRGWIAWAHLADVTTGAERSHAVDVARSLNPHYRGPEA
jgi:hypothetical protein